MNAVLIKSVIFSEEPDTLETAENSGAVLVPDPDSENGYRVEEAPSTWKTLTEEEYVAESSSENAIENMGLSSKFPFLFALTASICLVYLLNRFLKSGAGRIKWLGNILLTAVFFALFQHRWWIRLPRSVYYLFPVLEAVLLLAVISLVSESSVKIYIAVTFRQFSASASCAAMGSCFWNGWATAWEAPRMWSCFLYILIWRTRRTLTPMHH
ncbi:MAG: hypothetical protein ACLVAW_24040 [Eisenbergiella massiliensis]